MYQLTLQELAEDPPAGPRIVQAAANPDITILKTLLSYYSTFDRPREGQRWTTQQRYIFNAISPDTTQSMSGVNFQSPISTAIAANLLDHLRLLLAAGADPNGIDRAGLGEYSIHWIRGRQFQYQLNGHQLRDARAQFMKTARNSGISHPVCPLTEGELEERRLGFSRFWTEPDVPDRWVRGLRAITALEIAAGMGNTESVDILRKAGADESAWLAGSDEAGRNNEQLFDIQSQNDGPISALSTSSPVHEAIAAGQVVMMWHLLSICGYSPNYCPRAAPTVALPPLSFAIARCDIINNPGIQQCLASLISHPQLDANICTPIFNVHPLHFAIAYHDPELLTWLAGFIPGGLGAAGTTALGHTLLHVASLPLTGWHVTGWHVNDRAPNIAKSIHCVRTLDSRWIPYPLSSSAYESLQSVGEQSARVPIIESKQHAQYATIQLLLEWGGCDVRVQDVDGNTALHYLAGTWNIHPEIIRLVRTADGGEETWQKTRNLWGLTPGDLWTESSGSSGRHDNPNVIEGS